MKKFFPILLSLLLLSVCLCACNGTHRDKAVIASAQQYADGGNFTQAESMLIRAISENPSAALYTALSKIFVAQDKLRDASLLLDSIPDSELYAQMQQLRPAAPTASHPSGIYNKNLQVSFLGEGGTLLVCQDDICPSLSDTAPEGSLFLTTIPGLMVSSTVPSPSATRDSSAPFPFFTTPSAVWWRKSTLPTRRWKRWCAGNWASVKVVLCCRVCCGKSRN